MPPWRPGSTRPGSTKKGMPTSWNSPLRQARPDVAGRAVAAADEDRKAALREHRIARHRRRDRRARAHRGIRRTACGRSPAFPGYAASALAASDQHRFVVAAGGARRRPPRSGTQFRDRCARAPRRARRCRPSRAASRIGRRLCAQRLSLRAVPADTSAGRATFSEARRIAVRRRRGPCARAPSVRERAIGAMAGRARDCRRSATARVEEQALAERDRRRRCRRRDWTDRRPRRRPRARATGCA